MSTSPDLLGTPPPRRGSRRTLLLALLLVSSAAWLARHPERWPQIPPHWNPWSALQLDAPPDAFTRLRLERLDDDPAACRLALAQSGMSLRALPDRVTGRGCGFDNAVEIRRSTVAFDTSFSLSCRTAVALALWERHVLKPAAREHLQGEVARIEHFGSYACRNVYGRARGRRSQHATADALDIAGFTLTDGRRVRVLTHWGDGADETSHAQQAAFLRALRDGACDYFDAVLGPDYNAAHRDHFHFDRGGFRACR